MSLHEIAQLVLYLGLLIGLTPVLGRFMARGLSGERTWLTPAMRPLERLIYRLAGDQSGSRRDGLPDLHLGTSLVQSPRLRGALRPPNASGSIAAQSGRAARRSRGLGVQHRRQLHDEHQLAELCGEVTVSSLTQMLGLAVQNFVSAATGIAVLLALVRGLARRSMRTIGNFWIDLVRSTLYVLLPLSFVLALVLMEQGVVQTFSPPVKVQTLEGGSQTVPLGPVASQVAIKELGTNGGGFFNVNSSHPLENPTPLSNFLQMLSILLIPAALTCTCSKLVGSERQGWAIFSRRC